MLILLTTGGKHKSEKKKVKPFKLKIVENSETTVIVPKRTFKLVCMVNNIQEIRFDVLNKTCKTSVHNPAVARNWTRIALRNCRFASNWPVIIGSLSLWETQCATVLLLELGVKTLCTTVVCAVRTCKFT